jgi:Family of unknown function (DUF5856)
MQLKSSKTINIDEFISYLFHVRNCLHLHHLATKSYATHVALNSAYEDLLGFIDTLAETAQTDKLLNLNIPPSKIEGTPLAYVQKVLEYVREYRNVFPYSFQQNIADEIEALLSSTIYKLKYLS